MRNVSGSSFIHLSQLRKKRMGTATWCFYMVSLSGFHEVAKKLKILLRKSSKKFQGDFLKKIKQQQQQNPQKNPNPEQNRTAKPEMFLFFLEIL